MTNEARWRSPQTFEDGGNAGPGLAASFAKSDVAIGRARTEQVKPAASGVRVLSVTQRSREICV
jgi:hypothetical protein